MDTRTDATLTANDQLRALVARASDEQIATAIRTALAAGHVRTIHEVGLSALGALEVLLGDQVDATART